MNVDGAERSPYASWLAHPAALGIAVLLVYLPTLTAGWLGYDDDWLIERNELLTRSDPAVLTRVFFDFDRDTRLMLGAEYLPLRDFVVWVGRGVIQLGAPGFRCLQLAIYVGAVLVLQRWARALPAPVMLAVWLFALHPVHAESVAWLAGLKDVLALMFVAAALLAYGALERPHRFVVLVFVALACLSKGAAVVAPALLLAHDLLARRRPDWPILIGALTVAGTLGVLHVWVGGIADMYADPLGATLVDRMLALATILARYLGISLLVHPSSLFYEVHANGIEPASLGSLVLLCALLGTSIWAWRRDVRWPGIALLIFLASVAPVSQILAPLQNRMADRYLFIGLLGPMLAFAFVLNLALRRIRPQLQVVVIRGALLIVGALALIRGQLFIDPIALFDEGTRETAENAIPAYMLAEAYRRDGQLVAAEAAYREAIRRDEWRTQRGLAAGNNLGRMMAEQGRAAEAIALYQELVARYPDDARVLHNLAVLERGVGDVVSADRHDAEVAERFPDYRAGVDRPGPL